MKNYLSIFLLFFIFPLKLGCEEKSLERAKSEFRKKNYLQVIKILEDEKNRENLEINFYLGISYYNVQNYEKAKDLLENLIFKTETYDPYIINESLRVLFDIYLKDKKYNDLIKVGEYILKKIEKNPKFNSSLPLIKNNLSRAYGENGILNLRNRNFQEAIENFLISLNYNPQNLHSKVRLGEAYYNTGDYEKAKEQFIDVIKNEKNNWFILFLSISFYREISDKKEFESLFSILNEKSLSYKIMKSFQMFDSGNYEEGFEVLKEEEIKRNTNGDITFSIINKVFPYDFSYSKIYLNFIKMYPESQKNNMIITNLLRAITDEENMKIFERQLEELFNEMFKDEKRKDTIVNLNITLIDAKFERRLVSIDDYIEKIKEYEKILERYGENKYKEEILKRIADLYTRIENYKKAREIYKKLSEEFKKEDYNLRIAECYLKEGNLTEAKSIVESFTVKNKYNEKAQLLLAKIYIETGETEKGMVIVSDIEKRTKNRDILMEIENIKSNIFEIKEPLKNSVFITFRKIENNFTRFVPPYKISFLNQISKELEFYPISNEKREFEFILKFNIEEINSTSEPYVMIDEKDGKFYYLWERKINTDETKTKQKNFYKVFYPVKETESTDFAFDGNIEVNDNKYILNLNFVFRENNWELRIKNYRNYGEPIQIEPLPQIQERNIIFWNVKDRNLNIKIVYGENKNILYYFPEIEIKKLILNEEIIEKIYNGKISVDNFELEIKDFIPDTVKLTKENLKIYNFKERIFRK